MLKNYEINGTEEIALVTPAPELVGCRIVGGVCDMACQ